MLKPLKTILALGILSTAFIPSPFALCNIQKGYRLYTVKELQDDFQQMRKAVERRHPAIYKFTDKKTFNKLFDQQIAKIDRPMDGLAFLKIAVPMVARIGCGHTRLFAPGSFWDKAPKKFFPLHVITPLIIFSNIIIK